MPKRTLFGVDDAFSDGKGSWNVLTAGSGVFRITLNTNQPTAGYYTIACC